MLKTIISSLAMVAILGSLQTTTAQCSNNVAAYNPMLRTMSSNSTFFLVAVPKAAVQTALKEAYPNMKLSLLDVPSDTSLFPNGFPKGMHPVRADISYNDDIRMSALQIDGALLNAGIFAQYVSKDGSNSPLAVSLDSYIAGENGPLPNGLVPAAASLLLFGGYPLRLGQFVPQSAAYQSENGGTFSTQCKWAVAPNSVSGPGVYVEAADMEFETIAQSASMYTAKAFQYIKNQPTLLPSGKCQRNTNYYNNATAMPLFRRGQVTLGPGADGYGTTKGVLMKASPDGSGVYANVDGYSACTQAVGYKAENCDAAAAQTIPNMFG